jgi:hypothetical protein
MRIGSRLIGPVRKEIVMSATWKIDAYALQRLLAGIGMGAVSSLAGVYSNQRQQMMEKLSLLPQIVASHVVISRDREVALRASQV